MIEVDGLIRTENGGLERCIFLRDGNDYYTKLGFPLKQDLACPVELMGWDCDKAISFNGGDVLIYSFD